MAKKAILEVLESTIGRYVLNLDAESLNVAVWSGKIELQSLQLDTAAVNSELARRAHEAPNLACPFKVMEGRFDKVQLDVPWARLSSKPVIFHARGLYVWMEPHDFLKDGVPVSRGKSQQHQQQKSNRSKAVEERNNSIARAEAARKRANAVRMAWEEGGETLVDESGEMDDESSAKNSSTFTSRLVRRIVENLQFEIADVHLAVRGCGCAAGVVLGSLSLVTTDSKGTRTFVDRQTNSRDPASSFLYKELLISGFGIYLQNETSNNNSVDTRQRIKSLKISEKMEYVLSPLSFQAKLRQSDLDHCVDFPKYLVHSKLQSLNITLSRTQLELGHRLALAVAPNSELRPLFPEYRPLEPILGNAKQWWRYAVRCIGRLNRHRSWMEFYMAFQKRKVYLELYKRHTFSEGAPWLTKLKVSERAELERIESDRSISMAGLMHWRTIADAQVEKEREKHKNVVLTKRIESGVGSTSSKTKYSARSSLANSLFGSTPRKDSSDDFYECLDDENDAPIALSVDEMKELEELAFKKANQTLTKDSMFCDINFTLGSFQVNLIKSSLQPLTSLEMGMVSTSFKANADGSFAFGISLLSLEVLDSVTPDTFYPTICRSLQKAHSNKSQAFQFELKKSQEGDQELVLKMVACEIVASPLLLFAVKEFFRLPVPLTNNGNANGNGSRINGGKSNPVLLQSMSGSEDLFFDAREGVSSTMLLSPLGMNSPSKTNLDFSTPAVDKLHQHAVAMTKDGKVSDKLSSAIMDAWNGKNQKKQMWTMDFDISAPILILPENCIDPSATVLICNFGRFNFTYGNEALSHVVVDWFNAHQRPHKIDSEVDHLKLEMNDLSFTISSVGDATEKGLDGLNLDVSNSVIQPVSFTLDIGLEHAISSGDDTPRTCVIGILPAIIMRLGPSHVNKILRVAAVWSSNLHKLRGDTSATEEESMLHDLPEEPSDLEIVSSGSGISILDAPSSDDIGVAASLSKKDRLESMLLARRSTSDVLQSPSAAVEYVHVSVSLLRLSVNIYTDNGDGIEAHLVSVVASSSLATDGSSSNRIRMGWFWILDRLESEQKLPRRQRLVCHSNLPRSASFYAEKDKYADIMEDLTKQGVFKSSYLGSADLADINIVKLPALKARNYHKHVKEFSHEYIDAIQNVDQVTVINAKFTSLFINWNPPAIKTLFTAKSELLDFKEKAYSTYEQMSALQSQERRVNTVNIQPKKATMVVGVHSFFILAQMETFEMSLNSAKDDLPLFTLTMSDSKVNHHAVEGDDNNSEMIFVLGDFRLETPISGCALESYRTILGLAPSASTSLLTFKYCKGVNSVISCNVGDADKLECEACAEIVLSPMRFVHIHSQVFTLIEYVTEGVLGAMAANVASSAAAAAMEVAKSSQMGEKLFYVVASGFDFVLPQAAYSEKHFSFHTGKLEAHYRILENDVGSEAQVSLTDLSMYCEQRMAMVSAPVNMTVAAKLKPPLAPGTEDERATRVDMSTSRIQILIARTHYAQMMHTLDCNISEQNNFLRAENSLRYNRTSSTLDEKATTADSLLKNLSHAGGEVIEVIKRMYINFNIQELSVELCGTTTDDPILSVAAVKAHILMKLLPDEKQTKAYVTLHDLVCDDRRVESMNRTFRRMIGRANENRFAAAHRPKDPGNDSDVFLLNYTKYAADDSRDIEVKIGSSQVVVLPDVITEILDFIKVAPYQGRVSSRQSSVVSEKTDDTSMQVVVKDDDPDEFEASFQHMDTDGASALKKTKYNVESSNMRLVLVDLGSMDSSSTFLSTKPSSALTETIVLQGKMQANFEMTTNTLSDATVEKDYKIDAERVEIYTAKGNNLQHPVQIMEPAKFAIFYYQKDNDKGGAHLTDLKFVTLTPIDVTISMQNAALASALATSISDSFFGNTDDGDTDAVFHSISAKEASRIARIDSALEKVDVLNESTAPSEHLSDVSIHVGKQAQRIRRIVRMKMTSPEVTLTTTNDFQGMDEALFKIVAMNCVFGGELDYPGVSASEKPCFGCNMNTSFLADYFDAASNRWENLLTRPWEITFNASRGAQSKFESKRMSTTFDIESNPCHVSFSEHFLVSVGAASRMWSVYSGATKQATALVEDSDDLNKRRLSRSMAAHAARSLITTLPYAIENHSGINAMYSTYDDPARQPLPKSSTQFFQFELFPERGSGGMRKYGQDIKHAKSLTLYIGNTVISIDDMDGEINKSRSAHYISEYRTHVFTSVVKRGNSTILHLSSHVEMYNSSSLPFRIAVIGDDTVHDLGVVNSTLKNTHSDGNGTNTLLKESEELMTHSVFGLPAPLLRSFVIDTSETMCLQLSPVLQNSDTYGLVGMFNLPPLDRLVEMATSDETKRIIEVSCSPASRSSNLSSLVANICCKISLVDDSHPFVQLFIEPRAVMMNKLPVGILLRTPMPHTFRSRNSSATGEDDGQITDPRYSSHMLNPLGSIEVFTSGPSIAISMTCSDLPMGGTATGWIDGGWLDIPLGKNKRLVEPMKCVFPFQTKSVELYGSSRKVMSHSEGSEFFVMEADDITPDLKGASEEHNQTRTTAQTESVRSVVFVVCNYAVDHTGNVLFEEVPPREDAGNSRSSRLLVNPAPLTSSPPFSTFSSAHHRRRVSLLPRSSSLIRLIQLTMDGDEGMKRSVPFRVEDVSMTEGIDSMPILWADTTPSGYFAYRHLTAEGSELHVVPEYVIFNGSQHHQIWVKQLSKTPFLLDPSKISPIARDRNNSIVVQFDIPSINGLTGPVQIDKVGLRVCIAKSKVTGEPLGSLAVQTVTGAKDSRLVIKIGALNFSESQATESSASASLFEHDFIRLRIRWSEMRVTLRDTEEGTAKYEESRTAIRKYLEHHNVNSLEVEKRIAEARKDYNKKISDKQHCFPEVAQILLHRFTVDFQRIFKEEDKKDQGILPSNERTQFSIVIHNVRINDCSPNTNSPIVFDSMSQKSFFDLCIRTRGPLNADLIRVDLFDLNLAYGDGKAERIVVNTGEDFVWRLLDIANRTMLATAELAGVDLNLKWDEAAGKFSVAISDPRINNADDIDLDGNYCPPRSDKLFDVKKLRVSPFVLLLSFKRQPQSSRYKMIRGVRGAKITNYFTTRLKFTIDRAELPFQGYIARDIKGPPDRLADTIKAVYTTQLKSKMVTLMTATSFQDWKYLTARDSGGEEFIEGDFLRMTGNLAGRSAKFVLKKLGDGIGDSVVAVTGTIGGGIQDATETIGVGFVGAGINSLVSGLGEGVGSTVKGVGTGAGDILRGTGKGIGQAIGGIGGGVQQVTKGIGRGVTHGDLSGVGEGFASMGNGLGQGVETVVDGTVSGVLSAGKGLFSGAKSVGRGLGLLPRRSK